MFINYGKFEAYTLPDSHPMKWMENQHKIIFRRNAEGRDWYEVRATIPKDMTVLNVSDFGAVGGAENDATRINPGSENVVAVPQIPEAELDKIRFGSWFFDWETGELSQTPDSTVPPPEDELLPAPLTTRQFFVGITMEPYAEITEGQAMAYFRTGEIPPPLVAAIDLAVAMDLLPAGMTRFQVEALILAATEFQIDNPVSQVVAGVLGWTEEEMRAFWDFAFKL